MPHFVSEIKIKNFKSCINTRLKLSSFTPLVGYNNAGKSNSLTAIQWLISKSKSSKKDFNDPTQPIEITGTIEGISTEVLDQLLSKHRSKIEKYIADETLIIKRQQESPEATPASMNLSVFSEGEWHPNPAGIDNAIKALLPSPIRIGAMENAADDASKAKSTSTIGKLLAEFITPVKTAHEVELTSHLDEVSSRISADGDKRLSELASIDGNINEKIDNLFPGMSLKLHFNTPTFEELIKGGTIKVYESEHEGRDFTSYGHGAQRSIQMALVQYLAEVKKENTTEETTTLLLIDEPELYLHPFAIEQVREALIKLSKSGYQVILSTHSAQMITPQDAESTLLIRKEEGRGTYARERLNDAIQSIVPSSQHQMQHLFSLSHSTQVLFAEKVILTEGKTELRLLPFIFKAVSSLTMGQEKLALVPQGGVDNTHKSMEILEAMDLPVKAIVDLDYIRNVIKYGFIEENDPDISTIKSVFTILQTGEQVTLSETGFPKNGVVKAAKAFELMANHVNSAEALESIHQKLKSKNIWIWKKGAIEAHLDIEGKNEAEWARLKTNIETNGLEAECDDFESILDLIEWLQN